MHIRNPLCPTDEFKLSFKRNQSGKTDYIKIYPPFNVLVTPLAIAKAGEKIRHDVTRYHEFDKCYPYKAFLYLYRISDLILKMTTAKVIKTSVNINTNSPSQDSANLDDLHPQRSNELDVVVYLFTKF